MIFKREKKLNTVFERKGSVSGQVFAWGLNKEMDVFFELKMVGRIVRFDLRVLHSFEKDHGITVIGGIIDYISVHIVNVDLFIIDAGIHFFKPCDE